MKKSVKNKWIEALKSGKYKRGQEALKTSKGTFCCLGVLCDILGQGEWKKDHKLGNYTFNKEDAFLDNETAYAAGIKQNSVYLDELMKINDWRSYKGQTDKKGYARQIKYIEKNWEKL